MERKGKIKVRYLLVTTYKRGASRSCVLDVAILTEGMRYVEYEANTRKTELTPSVQAQYRSILADYQLTPQTKIYFSERVPPDEPARLVLRPIAQQLGIEMRTLRLDKMMRRLCHLRPSCLNRYDGKAGRYVEKRKGAAHHFMKFWRKMVKAGSCPWITEAYDGFLGKKGPEYARRKRITRLGMYYLTQSARKQSYDKAAKDPPAPAQAGEQRPVPAPEPVFETGLFS